MTCIYDIMDDVTTRQAHLAFLGTVFFAFLLRTSLLPDVSYGQASERHVDVALLAIAADTLVVVHLLGSALRMSKERERPRLEKNKKTTGKGLAMCLERISEALASPTVNWKKQIIPRSRQPRDPIVSPQQQSPALRT